ncbi:MAG: hypothetical protein R2750_01840 [Bacteroidales bacterium]
MIRIKCTNCDKIHEIDESEIEFENVGTDPDRQMGVENMYSSTKEFECDNCKNEIIVEFNFWEYPESVLNYSEFKEEGCILLDEPDYISYLPIK